MNIENKSLLELREIAKEMQLTGVSGMKKAELAAFIAEEYAKKEAEKKTAEAKELPAKDDEEERYFQEMEAAKPDYMADIDSGTTCGGVLEVLTDGYGFLRSENYLSGSDDIYVSPSQIKRFNLKTGDHIYGKMRAEKGNERFRALLYLLQINGDPANKVGRRPVFEKLTPIYPEQKIRLEYKQNNLSTRLVDIIAPIGKGQRGMIVAQPKAGKTVLIKDIANAVVTNHPEMHVIVLLIDERPEEVTDMQLSIN